MSHWSQAQDKWPGVVYIHVNKREQLVQRAFHHGKDMPLNITSHIKEGTNEIRLDVLQTPQERTRNISYAIAVEVLCVTNTASIKSIVSILPAADARGRIQKRLSMHEDDDDVMIVDDYITIDLRDPFTRRIFDTPVRGVACTHWECFDLDTFLQTVTLTPATVGKRAPYLKCPICRKDARPNTLLIDEFLVNVRTTLVQQQKLEIARAIRVKADGSWETVLEADTAQGDSHARSSSLVPSKRDRASFESDLPGGAKREGSCEINLSQIPPAPEIIELD
jgi:hypothetical protein